MASADIPFMEWQPRAIAPFDRDLELAVCRTLWCFHAARETRYGYALVARLLSHPMLLPPLACIMRNQSQQGILGIGLK